MKTYLRSWMFAVCLVLGGHTFALGATLFEFNAVTTDTGPLINLTGGSNKLLDFLDQIINNQASFSQLDNRDYRGSLTLLGVKDALIVTQNRSGTVFTLALTPIGVNRTFVGQTEDDVSNQVTNYFEKEGGINEIARFWKAIAAQSSAAITDGNPKAATASTANASFTSQGFTSVDEITSFTGGDEAAGAASKPRFSGLALGFNSGKFEAGAFKGTFNEFAFSKSLFRYVQLGFSASILDLDGAKIYGVASNIAVPIRLLQMGGDRNWNWRITPMIGTSGRASVDIGNGAAMWDAGIVNTLDYKVNKKLVVCLVNQLTYHKSISIPAGDFDYDPLIDQQILKTGVRAVSPLSKRFIVEGFVVDTHFLKEAAVKQFTTLGGAISFRITQAFNLSLGVNYDTGHEFKSYSGGLSSAWKW